jgi:hypothetical protein
MLTGSKVDLSHIEQILLYPGHIIVSVGMSTYNLLSYIRTYLAVNFARECAYRTCSIVNRLVSSKVDLSHKE